MYRRRIKMTRKTNLIGSPSLREAHKSTLRGNENVRESTIAMYSDDSDFKGATHQQAKNRNKELRLKYQNAPQSILMSDQEKTNTPTDARTTEYRTMQNNGEALKSALRRNENVRESTTTMNDDDSELECGAHQQTNIRFKDKTIICQTIDGSILVGGPKKTGTPTDTRSTEYAKIQINGQFRQSASRQRKRKTGSSLNVRRDDDSEMNLVSQQQSEALEENGRRPNLSILLNNSGNEVMNRSKLVSRDDSQLLEVLKIQST